MPMTFRLNVHRLHPREEIVPARSLRQYSLAARTGRVGCKPRTTTEPSSSETKPAAHLVPPTSIPIAYRIACARHMSFMSLSPPRNAVGKRTDIRRIASQTAADVADAFAPRDAANSGKTLSTRLNRSSASGNSGSRVTNGIIRRPETR